MDPNNILILDNCCEKVVYKKLYNVWSDYQEMSKLELSTWEENGVDVFYLHNSSKNKIIEQTFPVNIMADIINIIKNKYNHELEDRSLTYHQQLKDVQNHLPNLCMTAVGIAKGKYLNMLCDYFETDVFILSEFSVAEVHNEDQIKDVHRHAMNKLLPNCSHVIFTFLYKYRDEAAQTDERLMLHFIEAVTLSSYIEEIDMEFRYHENSNEYMDLLLNDIKNVFRDLKICEENIACIIYMDKTTVLEESEHVFKFLESLIRLPPLIKREPKIRINTSTSTMNTAKIPSTSKSDLLSYDELKIQNSKLKAAARILEDKYNNLLKICYKEKEDFKQKISKEVLSKITASRNELLQNQRTRFEEMMHDTNINCKTKVESLTNFYEELVRGLRGQLNHENVEKFNFKSENQQLQNTIAVLKDRLSNIQCLVLGGTPQSTPENNIERENIQHFKSQMGDLRLKNEKLNIEFKNKENAIENLLFQLNYYKDIKTDDDKMKLQLEAEKIDLNRQIENIQARHAEQFKEYEKLLKKSRLEIELHKREVSRLRQHINSDNFPPSPAVARLRLSTGLSSSSPDLRHLERDLQTFATSNFAAQLTLKLPEKTKETEGLTEGSIVANVPIEAVTVASPIALSATISKTETCSADTILIVGNKETDSAETLQYDSIPTDAFSSISPTAVTTASSPNLSVTSDMSLKSGETQTTKSAKIEKKCQTKIDPTTPASLNLRNSDTNTSGCVSPKRLRSVKLPRGKNLQDKENKSTNVLESDSPKSAVPAKKMKSNKDIAHSTISKSTSSKIKDSFSVANETSISNEDKNSLLNPLSDIVKLPEQIKKTEGSTESTSETVSDIEESPRKRLRSRPKMRYFLRK